MTSKNLTYEGIADFGDNQPKNDITPDNLATHGLVIMYQSLTENYSQPIATFASKNSVAGEELSKIIIKAVCLLEKAEVLIHGLIGDGLHIRLIMVENFLPFLIHCKKIFGNFTPMVYSCKRLV